MENIAGDTLLRNSPLLRIRIFVHPKTNVGGEKNFCPTFFVATNITKLLIILFFNWLRKNLGQFTKNYRTFYQKIVIKLSKTKVWDPRLGKNLFRISDPGSRVKKGPDPGSGSSTLEFTHPLNRGLAAISGFKKEIQTVSLNIGCDNRKRIEKQAVCSLSEI